MSELLQAAQDGDVPRLVASLDARPGIVNKSDEDGYTALHFAVLKGHLDLVRVLLARDADVDSVDKSQWQPIHCAALKGRGECVEMLLQAGANVNAETSTGCTPMHYAAAWGHTDILRTLIEAGGNVNAQTLFLEQTPLLMASEKGQIECVNLLLASGANVMMADSGGRTSLHMSRAAGHTECVSVLQEHVNLVPWWHRLPLCGACFRPNNNYIPLSS
eukprot:TRINITY_DN7194_c2_g1_i1.p1 TRINITY_DN7194_c2_g1~~TRINITY_DN7194_c2_g1_i1.p1  ORF type:complete len:218 (+),score=45.96 TRINITY_DN7194_c2_g1_i1:294-947(+)